jgi:hypothetical protein
LLNVPFESLVRAVAQRLETLAELRDIGGVAREYVADDTRFERRP